MQYIVYLNGTAIDDRYSDGVAKIICKLNLKKGDIFEWFPFNYFDDEKTDHKGERKCHHSLLMIAEMIYTMVDSWNYSIETKVEIFLQTQNK